MHWIWSGWRYFFEALWPRHRDKIKLVQTHIERHSLLMRNEVRLEHIQKEHTARLRALEHFETTEKSQQKLEYQSIRSSISPRTYGSALDRIQARTCPGTGAWLSKDAKFIEWIHTTDKSANILWLEGIPGAGVFEFI